jgi:RNA ligase (TIGR02306 family)
VVRIVEPVVDHPNADRLSLVKIGGYTCISGKLEDGSHRYKAGDLVVYVPEGALLPEWLLRREGFFDEEKGKGVLAGKLGNRVKAKKLRDIFSQGLLISGERFLDDPLDLMDAIFVDGPGVTRLLAELGDDVADWLEITKYEPVIPASMAGQTYYDPEGPVAFDFESIQRVPDLFEPGEEVEVTEKLHGTFCQIGFRPGYTGEGFLGGEFYVCSKGLGAKGLAFKDVPENDRNLYVRALRKLLDEGFADRCREVFSGFGNGPFRFFGEIIGQGVQDLGYGLAKPELRIFDISINRAYLTPAVMREKAAQLGLDTVPVLATMPYDVAALEAHRDGMDTLSGSHVREGVVLRSTHWLPHPVHGRKIGKYVSPDYLLRKGNATEYN